MSLLEKIEKELRELPPESQREVLEFIHLLRTRASEIDRLGKRSLKSHPAFGSWKERAMDAIQYQQRLRREWDP